MLRHRLTGRQSVSGLEWAVFVWAGLAAACVEPPPGSTAEQEALDVCALANDGDLCDDHQACTYPDACLNKKCVGMPVVDGTHCTDGNVCTINDRCLLGVCVGTVEADGTACTDGDPCTDPDVCMQGVCLSGGPLVCDDGNACTIDSCLAGAGCVFSPRDCGLPPDGGSDALMTPDAPAFDSRVDALLDLGGDAIRADGLISDAPPIDTGADVIASDAGGDAAPPGPDAAIDGGGNVDAAGSDGLPDAGGDLLETPPDLRARGGGCACAAATGGVRGWGTLAFVVGVIGVGAGRRGRGRGRRRERGRGRG